MQKTKTLSSLKDVVSRLKLKGRRIVFTNGCFDLIHPGHLKLLNFAKNQGDILIVGLNADVSVKKIKGPQRPVLDQRARAQILSAIDLVDYVVLFKEETPYKLIKAIKPDVLVKGGDWPADRVVGSDIAGKVKRVRILSEYSTTGIIRKIRKGAK